MDLVFVNGPFVNFQLVGPVLSTFELQWLNMWAITTTTNHCFCCPRLLFKRIRHFDDAWPVKCRYHNFAFPIAIWLLVCLLFAKWHLSYVLSIFAFVSAFNFQDVFLAVHYRYEKHKQQFKSLSYFRLHLHHEIKELLPQRKDLHIFHNKEEI